MLRVPELISDPVASPPLSFASRSAFFCCSSLVSSSTGRTSNIFSVAVGSRAKIVKVQSVWFCSNRLRRLQYFHMYTLVTCQKEQETEYLGYGIWSTRPFRYTYFSRAILSLLIRSLASEILDKRYCPARYPAPRTPKPTAIPFRWRWNHRFVAPIIA